MAWHASAGALAALLAAASTSPAAAPREERKLEEAAAQYRAGNFGVAFDRLSGLADAGHPDAARIALFMHVYGPPMYGRYWSVAPERMQRWQRVAARAPSR